MRGLIWLPLIVGAIYGEEISSPYIHRQIQKGEKIANALCKSDLLPQKISQNSTIEALIEQLEASKACTKLSEIKQKAVAYYLQDRELQKSDTTHIHAKAPITVPTDAKCPVCGMFVTKYPKWAAHIVVDGKSYYFDGVKDMMKYYIFDGDFPYDRKKISLIEVNDYYTLQATAVKDAYFVYDSDVFGPMGRELIPFADEASAKSFMRDHHGKTLLRFDEITQNMVLDLDG